MAQTLVKPHRVMVDATARFLESIGATDVMTEVRLKSLLGTYPWTVVVDLTATGSKGEKIVAECGSIHNVKERLRFIVGRFDVVYWMPSFPFLFKLEDKDILSFVSDGAGIQCECRICGYKWTPRIMQPKTCPSCKHRDWQERGNGDKTNKA